MVEIKLLVYHAKPDFVAFCETWLKHKTPKFVDYSCVWKNRVTTVGGGLGFIVRRGLQFQQIDLVPYNEGILEVMAIRIFESNNSKIDLLNIYNPNQNMTINEIKFYISQLGEKYIILGDFNAHSIILDDKIRNSNFTGKTVEKMVLEEEVYLCNPINFYTHISLPSMSRSCLDLVMCSNNLGTNIDIEALREVGSDHIPIKVTIKCKPVTFNITSRKKWKINKENIKNYAVDFVKSDIIKPNSVDALLTDFIGRIVATADKHIGQTTGKPRRGKASDWWDSDCAKAIHERRCAEKLMKRNAIIENVQTYQEKAKYFKKLIKAKQKDSFKKYVSTINYETPISIIYKKFKAIKGYNPPEDPPLLEGPDIITDPNEKADLFCEFFQSTAQNNFIYDKTQFERKLDEMAVFSDSSFNKPITYHELENVLQGVKSTSPGTDGIPYPLIKGLDTENKIELLDIYNQCYRTTYFPIEWKSGLIITIPKPGKPKEKKNSYRNITLLSCIGKIYERLIKNRTEYITEKYNLLSPQQCGFRRKRSTMDVLLRIENDIREAINEGKILISIYIDLKSAFDTVSGEAVILKMIDLGWKGPILKIIYEFFTNRKNQVYYNGAYSETLDWNSGTPQGSVLSPILFNYMLQDLPEQENIKTYVYADDITIATTVQTITEGRRNLEKYLKTLEKFTKDWGLVINPQKTVIQYFTRKKVSYPIVRMQGQVLRYEKEHRLLGMILDSPKLNWREHVKYLIRDGRRRLDIMKCISSPVWGASAKLLKLFYTSYIRSKLDYGSILYDSAGSILGKLEVIQNSAMRMITGARKTSPILSLQVETYLYSLPIRRGFLHLKKYIDLAHSTNSNMTAKNLKIGNCSRQVTPPNSFKARSLNWANIFRMPPIKRLPSPVVTPVPPWTSIDEYINIESGTNIKNNAEFNEYIEVNYSTFLAIFSDGSKIDNPSPSVACAYYYPRNRLVKCWKLRPDHTVVFSELYAIYQSLISVQEGDENIIIFTDSMTSLQIISNRNPNTYNEIVYKIQHILTQLNTLRTVILHWVRAHSGISGNEIADAAAKEAHGGDRSANTKLFLSEKIAMLKQQSHKHWEENWVYSTDATCKGLFLRSIRDTPIKRDAVVYDKLGRREQVLLHRFRIGHVGVHDYLFRFRIISSPVCANMLCSEDEISETLEHYIYICPAYSVQRSTMFERLSSIGVHDRSLKTLLGFGGYRRNLDIIRIFLAFVFETARNNEL